MRKPSNLTSPPVDPIHNTPSLDIASAWTVSSGSPSDTRHKSRINELSPRRDNGSACKHCTDPTNTHTDQSIVRFRKVIMQSQVCLYEALYASSHRRHCCLGLCCQCPYSVVFGNYLSCLLR